MERRYLWFAFVAVGIGLVLPPAELAFKCRSGFEASEACVWARAYLPLTRVVTPAIVSPIVFAVLLIVGRARKRP